MFLQPKKTRYKKIKKGNLTFFEYKSTKLKFGEIGLKAFSSGIISARQIEAARRTVVRKINRKGKTWLRIFPNIPVTRKPNESRMGKGKGTVSFWVAKVSRGQVIFEICGIPRALAAEALSAGGHKLSIKTGVCF